MNKKNKINEIIYNGNRTYIKDGEVNTILNEVITKNNGDMTVEQLREVLKNEITMIYNNENEYLQKSPIEN